MERHNVALLVLFAVIAMAFPVLYLAHAQGGKEIIVLQYAYRLPVAETTEAVPVDEIPMQEDVRNLAYEILTKEQEISELPQEQEEQQIEVTALATSVTADSVVDRQTPAVFVSLKKEAAEKVEEEEIAEVKEVPVNETVSDSFIETLTSEIHRLTNEERVTRGLSALTYDFRLEGIATGQSNDMITRDYFAHISPEGCDLTCRVKGASYDALYWGENLIWIEATRLPDARELAATFMESWMDSGGHRKNIVSEDYTHAGVGVARAGGVVYVTVNFAQPK
tara:strand:+ start:180 stop:1019 length:840 start_codon:yes stop_codon:yes gene_type:complete